MSIEVSREGRLCRVTIQRPEKRNQLDGEHCRALLAALESANEDPQVGAFLLEGSGDVFCAGFDWDATEPRDAELHLRLFSVRSRLLKPLVCAVQGAALSAGLGLVANAHAVVCAQGSSFGLTELRFGLFPYAVYEAVAEAIGERRATELALTTRVFPAPEALQMGLVQELAPAFEYDDRANAVALAIAESSAEAVCGGLAYIAERDGHEDRRALARLSHQQGLASADLAEGVRAFREQRKAAWPSLPR
jgi:enoyl-CoA hydratase/carnithine racemase